MKDSALDVEVGTPVRVETGVKYWSKLGTRIMNNPNCNEFSIRNKGPDEEQRAVRLKLLCFL